MKASPRQTKLRDHILETSLAMCVYVASVFQKYSLKDIFISKLMEQGRTFLTFTLEF